MCNTADMNSDEIPEVVYDSARAKRGALNPLSPSKDRITIRLDKDILAWFKGRVHGQGGGNYQTLINDVPAMPRTPCPLIYLGKRNCSWKRSCQSAANWGRSTL
jgi:uncharacterized protein (DUF4415 family)